MPIFKDLFQEYSLNINLFNDLNANQFNAQAERNAFVIYKEMKSREFYYTISTTKMLFLSSTH